MTHQRPLALTMGEPAGIGGEIALAAYRAGRTRSPFMLIDDPARIASLCERIGAAVPIEIVGDATEAARTFGHALPVLPLPMSVPLAPGAPHATTAAATVRSIEMAVALARAGDVSGIVTNPIHKANLLAAGFAHPGHTEFLAALSGADRTVMMLAAPQLRVVPVTIHIALRDVPRTLTTGMIMHTALLVAETLRDDFGIDAPRLAVSGLNPHAGEAGRMGTEDRDVIAPAVEMLRTQGLSVTGPLAADTLFHAEARTTYDAALCMYHDQALIPIKTLAFDDAVNLTLGLPFIRTSPDHGTALDIAGRGIARPDSLMAALDLAATLGARRTARSRP